MSILTTLITGYEAPISTSINLNIDPTASAQVVTDGLGGLVTPTEGTHMLELSWTNESDGKVEVKHNLLNGDTFDLLGNDKLLADVYIPLTSTTGGGELVVGIWDAVFGWHPMIQNTPPLLDGWFTAEFDVSANEQTELIEISALLFEGGAVLASSGVVYVDNLRLLSSSSPTGPPPANTDDEYLDNVQFGAFNYFWDYGHPISGLARESYNLGHGSNTCASGATGMGIISIVVGSNRNFVSRSDAATRILKIIAFLEDTADRFHGAWPHWLQCDNGITIPFSPADDGADLVETAFVVQGLLVARQYFDSEDDGTEVEIRERSTRLWEEVEWSFFQTGDCIYWHWSPNYGLSDFALRGWMETQIVYVLAAASPSQVNRIPPSLYDTCWTSRSDYANPGSFYGIRQWVGPDYGGPLFWEHYNYLGLDPRNLSDGYCNYFRNSRAIGQIQQQHAIQSNHVGYGANAWGFTESMGPEGYGAWSSTNDVGVIAPFAALSNMPFTPAESMLALKHFYDDLGPSLWGVYGFVDAYHEGQSWYAEGYLGIDQGTIAPMIENHRTGLCWDLFMNNTEIQTALDSMNFIKDPLMNLLVNPGFEDGSSGPLGTADVPGWTKFGGPNGWIHSDEGEKLGARGLKLWDDYSGIYQSISIEAGESYTFACYMASFSREGSLSNIAGAVLVEWLGDGGVLIKTDTVGSLTGSNEADTWVLVESNLVAPFGATSAKLIAKNNGLGASPSGVAQYDGFSVVLSQSNQSSAPTPYLFLRRS